MENPFEILLAKLANIESQIAHLQKSVDQLTQDKQDKSEYMTLSEIIPSLMSAPTFYEQVKKKRFHLYKVGRRSYVKRDEFLQSFRRVTMP